MIGSTYLADRKAAPAHLGRVLVAGLGKSGRAVVAYLLDLLGTRVEAVAVAAGAPNEEVQAWAADAAERGADIRFNHEEIQGSYDLCIVSPGISEFSPFYLSAKAASREIIGEVEFAWRESRKDSRWVAITGTNGKTTTTALTAHLLCEAGFAAAAVGNIGDTCLEAVISDKVDVYVAEVSSYQLASTREFAPDTAVVLNITPDHLAWHQSHENYANAKWKVLANLAQSDRGVAVLNAVDDEVRAKVRELRQQSDADFAYVPLGTAQGVTGDMRLACGAENAAYRDEGGYLHVAFDGWEHQLAPARELNIKGEHNQINALAAATAALVMGARPQAVTEGLLSFKPLAHRIEPAGIVNGVACYNDSKATNVDAVLVAVSAFDEVKPIMLLGGRDKGTDLGPLVAACEEHAKAVVCFGESRERFLEAFSAAQSVQVLAADHMEDAFDAALAVSEPGDIILLSPACASFDEFSCFEERGEVFKSLVAQRAEQAN